MPDPTPATPSPLPSVLDVPASPTGTPWIPATAQKYIALAIGIALAVLGVLMGVYPTIHGIGVAFSVLTAVAGVLGIASPGLRTPTVKVLAVCLLAGAVLTLSACPKRTPIQQQAINCMTDMGTNVLKHAPEIAAAIGSGDWFGALETLLEQFGPAILCEANTLLDFIKGKEVPPVAVAAAVNALGGGGPSYEGSARLEAWLRTHAKDYK